MATNVMTLQEFADLVGDLADGWDGEQPAVLIGDLNGSVSVSEQDGYSNYKPVGYAHECFDGNGVWELGERADHRFFGTMLIDPAELADDAQEQLTVADFSGGDSEA